MSKRVQQRVEFYKDRAGGYRWRAVSSNGRIVDSSKSSHSTVRASKRDAEASGFDIASATQPRVKGWTFYKDKQHEHRWAYVGVDGRVIGKSSRGFSSPELAITDAERHGYKGNPDRIGIGDRWEFFQDSKGFHRWRRVAANGEIVSNATKGFSSFDDAKDNAENLGFKDVKEK